MVVAKQREIFLSGGEGDRYFQRNHTFYSNGRSADTLSIAAALYTKYIGRGDRVLEVRKLLRRESCLYLQGNRMSRGWYRSFG